MENLSTMWWKKGDAKMSLIGSAARNCLPSLFSDARCNHFDIIKLLNSFTLFWFILFFYCHFMDNIRENDDARQ